MKNNSKESQLIIGLSKTLRKKLTIIAIILTTFEYIVFVIDLLLNVHFNVILLVLAILWNVWAIVCWIKFRQST